MVHEIYIWRKATNREVETKTMHYLSIKNRQTGSLTKARFNREPLELVTCRGGYTHTHPERSTEIKIKRIQNLSKKCPIMQLRQGCTLQRSLLNQSANRTVGSTSYRLLCAQENSISSIWVSQVLMQSVLSFAHLNRKSKVE